MKITDQNNFYLIRRNSAGISNFMVMYKVKKVLKQQEEQSHCEYFGQKVKNWLPDHVTIFYRSRHFQIIVSLYFLVWFYILYKSIISKVKSYHSYASSVISHKNLREWWAVKLTKKLLCFLAFLAIMKTNSSCLWRNFTLTTFLLIQKSVTYYLDWRIQSRIYDDKWILI